MNTQDLATTSAPTILDDIAKSENASIPNNTSSQNTIKRSKELIKAYNITFCGHIYFIAVKRHEGNFLAYQQIQHFAAEASTKKSRSAGSYVDLYVIGFTDKEEQDKALKIAHKWIKHAEDITTFELDT